MKRESYLQQLILQTANSNSTVTALIDTLNFDQAIIDIHIYGAQVTTGPAVLQIAECDTSNGTFVAVNKLTYGTATDNVTAVNALGVVATAWNSIRWNIDLRGRMRYLQPSLTIAAADGSTVETTIIVAQLFGVNDKGLETAPKQNVVQLISA